MPTITYIDHNGSEFEADAPVGSNLMQVAVDNGVESVLGECGGACACATCHVYVDDQWFGKAEPASDEEAAMLEMVIDPMPNSRLGCQVAITDEMDGMIVRLPESQM